MTSHSKTILWIDIETVPLFSSREEWEESDLSRIWIEKYCNDMDLESDPRVRFQTKAPLFPEFSKIICISIAYKKDSQYTVKSLVWDEYTILSDFIGLIEAIKVARTFGGHNIKQFDLPTIAKRMVINGYILPKRIDFSDKKPREIDVVDTIELFGFGRKLSTGLDLMCVSLGISTPKKILSGDQVQEVYLSGDVGKIITYCEADTVATAQCYDRIMSGLPPTTQQGDMQLEKEIWQISRTDQTVALWCRQYLTGVTTPTTDHQKRRLLAYAKAYQERSALSNSQVQAWAKAWNTSE